MATNTKINPCIINQLLDELGWTNRELAAAVGVAPETLSRWKWAGQLPCYDHLLSLRDALNRALIQAGKETVEIDNLVKNKT